MISTVKCWTWPEHEDEPHQVDYYKVSEPGAKPYYLLKTSESKHYLDLLTDMLESYVHADIERFNKLKAMIDWAAPGLKKELHYINCYSDKSTELSDKYGILALVDISFVLEYNRRNPMDLNKRKWNDPLPSERFRPHWD